MDDDDRVEGDLLMRRSTLLSLFVSLFAIVLIVSPVAAVADSWTSRVPIPAVLANGLYIVCAGADTFFAGPGGTTAFYRYNVLTDTWVTRANVPGATGNNAAAVWTGGDFIYLTSGGATTTFRRYSISADTWVVRASKLTGAGVGADLVYPSGAGDFLYATRGFSGGGTTDFERYQITTDTWTAMASAPIGIANHGALTDGGTDTIYSLQGNNGGAFNAYHITGNFWDTKATYPGQAQSGTDLNSMLQFGFLYALNANSGTAFRSYKIATDTWATRTAVPTAISDVGRHMASSGTDSFIYVLGGSGTSNFYRYEVHHDTSGGGGNVADTPRIRFLATTPIDTRVATFSIRVSIDSATTGDSVRLAINNVILETQTMTATAETRTFTFVCGTYLNTGVIYVTRQVAGDTFSDSILVRLDTVVPSGSVLTISDTTVTTPTFRWTAATDSNAISTYRVILRSLADSSVLMAFDTSGLSAVCTTPLSVALYRADLSCTDSLGNTNSSVDSRSFSVLPDSSRVRIQATSPIDTRVTTFSLRAAIDSAVTGDTVRLIVNNVVIETQIMAGTNETRTFTVSGLIVLNDTIAVQLTRHVGGLSFSESILVRLDTVVPSGSTLTIADTTVTTPTFRWTAATDSNAISAYRVILRSLADSSVLMAFDTSGLSATCTTPLSIALYRADLSCTDSLGNTNSSVDSRSFSVLPDSSRVRIQATSPVDTRVTTFSLRAAIDSAVAGDTVRLIVNNVVIETQIMTGTNETRTFTVAGLIVLNDTIAVQLTRHIGGLSFSESILVRLDTVAPTGSVLTIADTAVRLPTIRWTAATDSNTVSLYRVTIRSLSDSSTSLTYETSGLSATIDSALSLGVYRADLICTDNLGNVSAVIDSRSFTIYADTPTSLTLLDSKTYIVSPNTFATDSARLVVKDSNGTGVPNYAVSVSIVARPTGASGDTFVRTVTDSNGRCTVSLKAGDKTGVYILKVSITGLTPIYLCYQTNELDITANQWTMIALPRVPTDNRVDKVLSLAPANIFHWDPTAVSSAKNLRYIIPTALTQGEGYFLYEVTSPRLTVTGTTLKTDTADLPIKVGWNQLGSPYAYLTRYNAARIITSGGSNISLTEAEAQGIISNKIFWYKDNAYQFGPNSTNADPMLSPWHGFWIFAAANATLRLSPDFYFSESTTSTLVSAQAAGDVNDWKIKVTANASSGASTVNYLGVSPTATEKSDFALDVENPPSLGNALATGLGAGSVFAQDLRAPFTSANIWLFSVTPSATDTAMSLQFGELSNLPADFVVRLVDLGTNEVSDVRANPSYAYSASAASARSFRIVVGTEAAVRNLLGQQLDQTQTFAYPNPGPGADGFVRFKYNVPAGGQLRLRIFDLSGRRVLDRYVDLNTFPTEYAWDCKNDRSIAIGTGVYIYIIDIGNSTGNRRFTDKLAIYR